MYARMRLHLSAQSGRARELPRTLLFTYIRTRGVKTARDVIGTVLPTRLDSRAQLMRARKLSCKSKAA